ncbi:hypothetical protein CMALT394_30161 [Carnobacterium maltaromaticum]|nr:hypothetical protein CMALT394_30161 [Carnobacterium maltaromaticum]
MLKEILSEFDGIISPSFIDNNMDIFRNPIRND